jgi:hypothetical protein
MLPVARLAAFADQRRRDLCCAQTIRIGLDHRGAGDATEARFQAPVVLADSAEIDGQDGSGLGQRRPSLSVRLAGFPQLFRRLIHNG